MGHKTMQGREIDMEKLRSQNELMPAIGNMKVNARGDELGDGGQIIRRREDIVAEYYSDQQAPIPAFKPQPIAEEAPIISAVPKNKKNQSEE